MKNEFDLEDKSEYLDVDYTPHEDEDNINSPAGKEFYRYGALSWLARPFRYVRSVVGRYQYLNYLTVTYKEMGIKTNKLIKNE